MRSRTRNCCLLFTAFQLVTPQWLLGEQYLIGYRLATKNSQIISENLQISKSMTPCVGVGVADLTLLREPNASLEKILRRHEDQFLAFAAQQPLHLQSHQKIEPQSHFSAETLTLKTQCYAVLFNDDFVTISHLK